MRKRIRIRIYWGKKKEIFHLDNQVGAIAFIPVLNVIYYLLTLVTARQRRFALFLETVLLLAIGSLLIRLSTGWLLSAVFAHVLTCIGIGIQQQLLDTSPDSRKKLGYVILFSAVFVLAMLAIAFAGRNAQNKMQPVCQEALEALTRRDEKRWQSCLHPTKAADELWDMDAFLSGAGYPPARRLAAGAYDGSRDGDIGQGPLHHRRVSRVGGWPDLSDHDHLPAQL